MPSLSIHYVSPTHQQEPTIQLGEVVMLATCHENQIQVNLATLVNPKLVCEHYLLCLRFVCT